MRGITNTAEGWRTITVATVEEWSSIYTSLTFVESIHTFEPGQFIALGPGIKAPPEYRREYSLVNGIGEPIEIFVRRGGAGSFSNYLSSLKKGATVLCSAHAKGHLVVPPSNFNRVFLIGFGSGMAPILSILSSPSSLKSTHAIEVIYSVGRDGDTLLPPYFDRLRDITQTSGGKTSLTVSVTGASQEHIDTIASILPAYDAGGIDIKNKRLTEFLEEKIESGQLLLDPLTDLVLLCGGNSPVYTSARWLRDRLGFRPWRRGAGGGFIIEGYG